MTTYTVSKQPGGRFGADALGSWMKKHWYSYDADATLADGTEVLLRASSGYKHFTAELASGHSLGSYDRSTMLKWQGRLRWDGVDYEFGVTSGWKRTFTLTRLNEELAGFAVQGFKQDIVITPAPGVSPDPGLLLFCAFISLVAIRQRAIAATA